MLHELYEGQISIDLMIIKFQDFSLPVSKFAYSLERGVYNPTLAWQFLASSY